MDQLSGKTAVVTGAASGIGLGMARRFAKAGMNVVLADVEEPLLATATEEITALGVETLAVPTDVSDGTAVDRLAAAAIERFGAVNVLCNNAGVSGNSLMAAPGELNEAEWRWVIDVNLWGVIHGHRAFLPHFLSHGDGHIVNTASMAGHMPGHSAYSVTKWAVVAMSEGLYHQLKATNPGVGISCLCPGWVNTKIAESDRNMPEWAAPNALDDKPEPNEIMEFVKDALANGMDPNEVGELVHDAIVNDKFWIFTDLDMVQGLKPRYDAILENRNPDTLTFLD